MPTEIRFTALGPARIAIGAVQGAALWAIVHNSEKDNSWAAGHPVLFAALVFLTAFLPVILLAGLGQLRRRTLIIWTTLAAIALVGIGAYAGWRELGEVRQPWPSPLIFIMTAGLLFIAHHLIAAADEHRHWRAPYSAYFDIAWKHGVQLALSVAFTGAFWLMMMLGSVLFNLIGLNGFEHFIRHDWFAIPASAIVFASAVHLTDVRAGLVRGIRTVALTLLAWLMPLMTAIAAAFILSLPFTGLKLLFATGNASELLLGAAGALIILINAAYQDGEIEEARARILKWGARAAAIVLVPIMALAAYAIGVRISQHGFTPERVLAVACVVVGAAYTIGYSFAAVRRGEWMKRLEPTNILTGFLAAGILLFLLSPLGDPARISVADQMHRLNRGQIAADKFDYKFLRFAAVRFGRTELDRLAATAGLSMQFAKDTKALKSQYDTLPRIPVDIVTFPAGRTIPAEVFADGHFFGPDPCRKQTRCVAAFLDIDSDGAEDIVVAGPNMAMAFSKHADHWVQVGRLLGYCPGDAEALAKGQFKTVATQMSDLQVNGRRWVLQQADVAFACPGVNPPPPPTSPSTRPASPAPPAKAPPAGR